MVLYEKNRFPLEDALFRNPTSEYRSAPFWAWNCYMTEELITHMVGVFDEMGMGGAHIHSRTGLGNVYLGTDFLELVRDAHRKLSQRKKLTWLYDEDRWPSGSAGGLVTEEHSYRMQFLVFSPEKIEETPESPRFRCGADPVRSDERVLLARYQVLLENGWLKDYARLGENDTSAEGYDEWYAYLETCGGHPWYNNRAYVNTLDQAAVDRFIRITHESYARNLGQEFGKTVPAIFTDEPQFCHKQHLNCADDKQQIFMPFTRDLEQSFLAAYGHSLLEALPELFWEKQDILSETRYQYHDHICERFARAFGDNIGAWCETHGLMLTGHMMDEATLKSQTSALGEVMRCMRSFQLPGIDMLFEHRELSTAKQAQSVSRQYGRAGVLSETYGGSNWDYDFRSFKLQGDWQAALGVTVRVPHLSWTSMAGEAKRDYPVPIGYQSPWYKEFKYLEDYFARINVVLSRGQADVRIGVIHPVESYWLYWGTEEKTAGIRQEQDTSFRNLIDWLLYGCLDFDFISESLLPNQHDWSVADRKLHVGQMAYDVVVVPDCVTLRSTTAEILRAFVERGGQVIFAGQIPEYVDAVPSKLVRNLVSRCVQVPFRQQTLLTALEPYRSISIRNSKGTMAKNLIYQLRSDGDKKYLFIAHVQPMKNPDLPKKEDVTITLQGHYLVTEYDPLSGEIKSLPCRQTADQTIIDRRFYEHDSLLLMMTPGEASFEVPKKISDGVSIQLSIPNEVSYRLSEPNVLVLDQAEYAFDDGPWQSSEELLRIDNLFRSKVGYTARTGSVMQPWAMEQVEKAEHLLKLCFTVCSQVDVENVQLAIENRNVQIWFNGAEVSTKITGWYVDKAIHTVNLGTIRAGNNKLLVEIPYSSRVNVENLFLLGDFGVIIRGAQAELTAVPEKLAISDITTQGFPFYGGNITFEIPVSAPDDGIVSVTASMFRSPLLKLQMNDGPERMIAFSPYETTVPCCAGKNTLYLTAYGNRANTFGPVHNCSRSRNLSEPKAWRSVDAAWAYEYQLKPTGLLKSPVLSFCGMMGAAINKE